MTEPKKTKLILIRHGEAISNVEPIIGGMKGDRGLTELGIRQAEALRDRLAHTGEIRADVLIASPLARAKQTAEIIQPALNIPIQFDDAMQELHVGEADGMHVAEYKEKFGLPDFRNEPFRAIAPRGENWGSFLLRVAEGFERILREHHGKNIVIICHGGVIDASFILCIGMNSLFVPPIEFATINTSITHWETMEDKGIQSRWRLMRYNDAYHTMGVGRNRHIKWNDVPLPEQQVEGHTSAPVPTEEANTNA